MELKNGKVTLICTASYDRLTCFLTKLISVCANAESTFQIKLRTATDTFKDILIEFVDPQAEVTLIFCGHGTENHLITGTEQDCSNLKSPVNEGVFFDTSSLDPGPNLLAALACEAGSQLGRSFSQTTGGKFFGYHDKLSFIVTDDEDYNFWWRRIICATVDKITQEQNVTQETIDFVRRLYEEAHTFFISGEGRMKEKAFGMRMCLLRNLNAMCHY